MKSFVTVMSLVVASSAFADPGFILNSSSGPRSDVLEFNQTIYTGACPGNIIEPVRGYFFDAEIPTAEGRRVKIVNVTPGVDSDPYPFTDREYNEGGRSEKIDFYPGSSHRQRYFSVVNGINNFEVTVSQGERVIDTRLFSFPVRLNTRSEQRMPICRYETDCRPAPPMGGVMCLPRTVCSCPFN